MNEASMIEIVAGDARDVPAIMPVMHSAFDPAFGEAWTQAQCLAMLSMPNSRLLLARFGSTLAGFAISRWVLDEEELLMIGVAADKQRSGIGTRLLDHIIDQARAAGREILFLEARDQNSAIRFYNNANFNPVGRRKGYYHSADGAQYDAITMSLTL